MQNTSTANILTLGTINCKIFNFHSTLKCSQSCTVTDKWQIDFCFEHFCSKGGGGGNCHGLIRSCTVRKPHYTVTVQCVARLMRLTVTLETVNRAFFMRICVKMWCCGESTIQWSNLCCLRWCHWWIVSFDVKNFLWSNLPFPNTWLIDGNMMKK